MCLPTWKVSESVSSGTFMKASSSSDRYDQLLTQSPVPLPSSEDRRGAESSMLLFFFSPSSASLAPLLRFKRKSQKKKIQAKRIEKSQEEVCMVIRALTLKPDCWGLNRSLCYISSVAWASYFSSPCLSFLIHVVG